MDRRPRPGGRKPKGRRPQAHTDRRQTSHRKHPQQDFAHTGRIRADRKMLGRIGWVTILCIIFAFLPVVAMLANLMLVHHEEYAQLALDNQTRVTGITASRGTIYDRNMNVMAVSTSVETVFLDPLELDKYKDDRKVTINELADYLAGLLNKDPQWIREQAGDITMRYKVIATKQDRTITDQIRAYISENEIIGIHMEPDSKRVYPYSTLAAQLIGFTNASNQGAEGVEARYNRYLEGTAGKVITTKGNYETVMPYSYEKYYEASDGNSVVLTVDTTIQYYLEKNMEEAVSKYDVQNGAFGLVMNAKTGEILAMATLGSYDPNNYLEILDEDTRNMLNAMKLTYQLQPEGTAAHDNAKAAYTDALVAARLEQWRNRVVSDGYEPGSTFKIITMAAALEEGTTTAQDSFYCAGEKMYAGRTKPLHCWQHNGHGSQTTFQALQNSCNLALADIGLKLGGETFYTYVRDFGLMEATGVGLSGEASGYFFDEDIFTTPGASGYDAAVIASSFGQTFTVTPIQLVRAIAAVVNGGYLMQPYVVSEILDDGGNVVESNEPTVIRQVISEKTSQTMREMILSVVEEGTAKNARIAGYAIGGKTGTAEKTGQVDAEGNAVEDKIVSFVGIAPMDDPEYIVLVALDTPSKETGIYISGGVMAAPTVRGVLEDILPYMGVPRDYSQVDMSTVEVTMPDLMGLSETEAAKLLTDESLRYRTVGSGTAVTGQIPAPGSSVPGTSQVILYMGENAPSDLVAVPDFSGMTISQANKAATEAGLYILIKGANTDSRNVIATGQDVAPEVLVVPGTIIRVDFTDQTAQD